MVQAEQKWRYAHASDEAMAYHRAQFSTPYHSTVAFCDWLEEMGVLPGNGDRPVADIASGLGANAHYLTRRHLGLKVVGIDVNRALVDEGRAILAELNDGRASLEEGDLYHLAPAMRGRFSGVVTFQTLSWLPAIEPAIDALADLEPDWIAGSSLFFDGEIDATIQLADYGRPTGGQDHLKAFYNIYSLPRLRRLFAARGYHRFSAVPFAIGVDLAPPAERGTLGTYTERLADGRRLQFSGPLYLPWHFILARR